MTEKEGWDILNTVNDSDALRKAKDLALKAISSHQDHCTPEKMYKEIDEFIKKYSVRDFVEVLFNVLKDQNEEKKNGK